MKDFPEIVSPIRPDAVDLPPTEPLDITAWNLALLGPRHGSDQVVRRASRLRTSAVVQFEGCITLIT